MDRQPPEGEDGVRHRRAGGGKSQRVNVKLGPFRAMALDECAATRLGLTRSQRSEHLRHAVERGDLRRVRALLEAGVDIECSDEYGHTPLFVAAWRGRAGVAELLLQWGARASTKSNDGTSPVGAAAACGHGALLQVLGVATPAGAQLSLPRPPSGLEADAARQAWLTPIRGGPLQQGDTWRAFYLDGVFSESFLHRLEALWRSLPVAPREEDMDQADSVGRAGQERKRLQSRGERRGDRSRQGAAPRRSYFCDVVGAVTQQLVEALARRYCQTPKDESITPLPCKTVYAHMRFLHYAEPDGYLAPHLDLARTNPATGRRSTHTFILYLDGAVAGEPCCGGETVLLERLDVASPAVASISPVRGRLLVFPHEWPHKAVPVARPPKLLLRGEML